MSAKLWDTSENGSIEYRSFIPEYIKGSMGVLHNSFFVHENLCIGVELSKHPEAAEELEALCLTAAKDGVSIVAINKDTGEIVGVMFNKIQEKTDQPGYFKKFAQSCKNASSVALLQFMDDADTALDLYELCNANCLLELMFLAVLPAYRNRGIGYKLIESSVELVKQLISGKNAKTSLDDKPLPLEPIPTGLSVTCTAKATARITTKLEFATATEISFERYMFEGKSFASRIGPDPPIAAVKYRKI